jgi:hypothetical protein
VASSLHDVKPVNRLGHERPGRLPPEHVADPKWRQHDQRDEDRGKQALGAKTIHLGPLSELSPIDPSTGNQFNPPDPFNAGRRLAISVEDAQAYRDFVADLASKTLVATMLPRLVDNVHPLALGNVHRVHKQIKQLGQNLLRLHGQDAAANKKAVEKLTSEFYSHLHMVNRNEALEILGSRVQFADDALAHAMDALLHCYETQFNLRTTFSIADFMGDDDQKDVRFAAGAIESTARSYLLVTTGRIGQHSKLGAGVQVQLAPSQKMPLIKGLPREYDIEVGPHGWVHNFEPKGLTL